MAVIVNIRWIGKKKNDSANSLAFVTEILYSK